MIAFNLQMFGGRSSSGGNNPKSKEKATPAAEKTPEERQKEYYAIARGSYSGRERLMEMMRDTRRKLRDFEKGSEQYQALVREYNMMTRAYKRS